MTLRWTGNLRVLLALVAFAAPLYGQAASPGSIPVAPTLMEDALGIRTAQQRLSTLRAGGRGTSSEAVDLRLTILERVLRASFDVDSVLGRIDTEAAYMNEDTYALQVRSQHENAMLNLATLAASGALGAAGSSMQLTHGLNHAGTALQAASGGTALILSGIQLHGLSGGKRPIRSHYNMLAQLLDRRPNAESTYPADVLAYLNTPGEPGKPPLGQALVEAWYRLHRVAQTPKDKGATIDSLTADRTSSRKLGADELADREAMLHDLHATVILMRLQLQTILIGSEASPTP